MIESQSLNETMINLHTQITEKDKQIYELKEVVRALEEENYKLRCQNSQLLTALSKNKKMKNMQIQTLNKIIKNLKQQCQIHQNAPQHQQPTHSNRNLKRIKTQKDFPPTYPQEQPSLIAILHEMRLEMADMKQSHLRMQEDNEKIRYMVKEQSNRSFYENSSSSSTLSLDGLNMGECFMGRKSRLRQNQEGYFHKMHRKTDRFRPQSQFPKMDSWDGIQEKLNFIKEENEQLRRSLFD